LDMVMFWLGIDFLLLIGFVTLGFYTERNINRRAKVAITRPEGSADDRFTIWVRSLWLGDPRMLAIILGSPIYLSLSLVTVITLLILPFPLPTEIAVSLVLFLLFFDVIWWLSHVYDKAKELRKKSAVSTQATTS
jgi:hypothetical protein